MYNIIPLIIISVSLFIILVVVIRKFSALANLDVENMPAEKEARFKEQIAESRLKRNITKWSSKVSVVFRFSYGKLKELSKKGFEKLYDMRKQYNEAREPESEEEKEIKIKQLFMENENFKEKDDFEEKEKNLIKIIEFDSKNIGAFQDLGELYFENKKYEEAKQAFAHVLKLVPDEDAEKQADIYYDLSLVYKETEENDEAKETIKMAGKIAPNNPRYLNAMIEIGIISKDKFLAQTALEKLEEVNPENAKLAEFKEKINELD